MSKQIEEWLTLDDPAALFLAIWSFAVSPRVPRADLAGATRIGSEIIGALGEALSRDDGPAAVREVCAVLANTWTEQATLSGRRLRAGLLLCALRAIDDAVEHIHPRTPLLAPGMGGLTMPVWLVRLRERRLVNGFYACRDGQGLIARGPFARNARGPLEIPSFSLTDQFSACAVVPLAIEDDGRNIAIRVRIIDQGIARGVPPRPGTAGAETISLAPLAEAKDDLRPLVREVNGTHYLDVTKGESFAPQAMFARLIEDCAGSDALLLPELVFDEADVRAMQASLATAVEGTPRIILCGSGLVANGDEHGDKRPWNQANIVNGTGALLWCHRKAYAYGMLEDTRSGLIIPGADDAAQLMDDIEWSDEIIVADIEGFGRCVVLICQDLMLDAVEQLVGRYEPDWVFVPILDSGTNFKRWPFRRIADLSAKGPARYVVVSSLTMQHWQKDRFAGEEIGIAVGPRHVAAKDKGIDGPALAQEVSCESQDRRHATIMWRGGVWQTVQKAGVLT